MNTCHDYTHVCTSRQIYALCAPFGNLISTQQTFGYNVGRGLPNAVKAHNYITVATCPETGGTVLKIPAIVPHSFYTDIMIRHYNYICILSLRVRSFVNLLGVFWWWHGWRIVSQTTPQSLSIRSVAYRIRWEICPSKSIQKGMIHATTSGCNHKELSHTCRNSRSQTDYLWRSVVRCATCCRCSRTRIRR